MADFFRDLRAHPMFRAAQIVPASIVLIFSILI